MTKPVPVEDLPSNIVPSDDLPIDEPQNKPSLLSDNKDIDWSSPEVMAANPVTRFVKGAASLPLGIMQGVDEAASWLASKIPGAAPKQPSVMSDILRQNERMTQAGRSEIGSTGFDPWEMGGAILGPGPLKGASMIKEAPGVVGKVKTAIPTGAVLGASQPVTGEGNFADQKIIQALTGATVGATIPPAAALAGRALKGVQRGADLILPGGVGRISDRRLRADLGDEAIPDVIKALEAARNKIPNSKPTAASAVAHLPGGSPLIARQNLIAGREGGPSAKFGERITEQQAARRAVLQDLSTRGTPKQQIVGRALRDALVPLINNPHKRLDIVGRENPEKFIQALVDNDQFVKRATKGLAGSKHGIPEPLDKVFNKTQMRQLLALADEVNTMIKMKNPAQKTKMTGIDVGRETGAKVPPMLSRPMMITNAILKAGAGNILPKIEADITKKLLNPQLTATALKDIEPSKLKELIDAILNSGKVTSGLAANAGLQEGK